MNKKLLLVLSAITVVSATAGIVSACKPEREPEKTTYRTGYTLTESGAHIKWDAVEGSTGYVVQKSPTRCGEYTEIDYVDDTTEYDSDDIYAYYRILAVGSDGNTIETCGPYSFDLETFGSSTYAYSPDDDMQLVQAELDEFYNKTDGTKEGAEGRARGEFSEERFSAFFKEGDYNLNINVGYYTTLSGLGASPDDVTISKINTDAPISLCNFWRAAENLSVNGDMLWSVSQATSLRRVHIKGKLNLSGSGSTSGGFLADTKVDGTVNSGSQQQWFSRNALFGKWNGGVWNMAFVGVEGDIPQNSWKDGGYTNISNSGNLREKPFLTFDETNGYRVFVPSLTTNAKGVSWQSGNSGNYIPLSEFYVARSDRDSSATINAALAEGKHVLFSAGIYELDEPLVVSRENTVILGMGMATLRPAAGNNDTLLRVADVGGVSVSGLLFDAGNSTKSLLEAGENNCNSDHSQNPALFADLFFRVGGAKEENTSVDACVVINSKNVIGDNFWVWRADHWDGVGWDKNVAENGVIVNGDNVTFYGLFVEHFLGYQTLWNGNGGVTYFYQSELPYDVPNQESWLSHGGTVNGYASYKVSDGVTSHKAYSLGVYSYLRDATVRLENAVECPEAEGVSFYHLLTVYLNGYDGSGIDHVINGEGNPVQKGKMKSGIEEYPAKVD